MMHGEILLWQGEFASAQEQMRDAFNALAGEALKSNSQALTAETRKDVGTRIRECLDEIIAKKDENLIIVSHGNALTFIIMAWLKIPVENMNYCSFQPSPARVTYLQEDDVLKNRNVIYICREID